MSTYLESVFAFDRKVKALEAKNKQLENDLAIERTSATYHCKENQRKNDVIYDLKSKNKQQEKLLIEAVKEIQVSVNYDSSWIKDTSAGDESLPENQRYKSQCEFLQKPEIKELLERNEKDAT